MNMKARREATLRTVKTTKVSRGFYRLVGPTGRIWEAALGADPWGADCWFLWVEGDRLGATTRKTLTSCKWTVATEIVR